MTAFIKKNILGVIYLLYILTFIISTIYLFKRPLSVGSDSAYYLMGAENLASGKGFYAFNIYFNNDTDKLKPITEFQPLYSYLISLVFRVDSNILSATKIINIIFWIVFFFTWLYLYYLFFNGFNLFSISSAFLLLFSCGMWYYPSMALSETVFLGLLSLLCLCLYLESQKQKIIYSILIGLLLALLVLNRYAAIGVVVGTGLYYLIRFLKGLNLAQFIYLLIVSLIPTLTFLFFFLRNRELTSHGMFMPVSFEKVSGMWNVTRFFEVLNYLSISCFGVPSSTHSFAWLIIVPVFFSIAYISFRIKIFKKVNYSSKEFVLSIIIMLVLYLGVVFVNGLQNLSVNISSGFYRYFWLTQPLFVIIILFTIKELPKNQYIHKVLIVVLACEIILMAFSGINRTVFIFENLDKFRTDDAIYEKIKSMPIGNNFFMSNMSQIAYFKTKKPFREIGSSDGIKQISDQKGTQLNKYILLNKSVGIDFRKGVPIWNDILSGIKYEIDYEDTSYIFVKLIE